jgi:sphingomyelin phosphodiesterase acid-like 3
LSSIWVALIKDKANKARFLQDFSKAGYYAVDISPTKKILVLDTVLFSPHYQRKEIQQAANQQLSWLTDQLNTAKKNHQAVLIACHIPPAVDLYLSSIMSFKIFKNLKNFWTSSYHDTFLSLIQKFSDTIVGVLAGHVHFDLFQLKIEGNNNQFIPILFTPSVSPIFGNNPAIKVFNYDDTSLHLLSVERYHKPLSDPSSDWRKARPLFGSI